MIDSYAYGIDTSSPRSLSEEGLAILSSAESKVSSKTLGYCESVHKGLISHAEGTSRSLGFKLNL